MAITSTGSARRAYTEEQWNEMKPHFIKLYKDDKNTLKYTMDQLRQVYGFKATEKMYKTHIKRWGLEKYNKDDELLYLIRLDREQGSVKDRAYTINGRPTTVEDAKRHFRRKKVKSLEDLIAKLPAQMPDTIEIDYEDNEEQSFDFSIPLQDQQEAVPRLILHTGYPSSNDAEVMDFDRVTLSPDDIDMSVYSPFSIFHGTNSPGLSYQDIDMDIDDIDPEEQRHYGDNYGAVAIFRQRKPSLIKTPGLEFATHSFLRNMSDFGDMIVNSILSEPIKYPQARRFNQLWDLFCTTSTHMRQKRTRQALLVHDEARLTFSRMLTVRDPWLLLSLCLVLNDNLSNENKMNADSFLNDMSKWTNKLSADHPIVRLVRDLQNTTERTSIWASYLLEATVRMISERLNEAVGIHHDLSLELSRLHARTLTTVGMHSSAETLLSQDLAMVEDKFGSRSLQNFLRLSALARAHYVAKDYDKALNLYQKIISESTGWADESSLADIKYGAMYFIAKSHAAKGDYMQATDGAQRALRFALEKQGPEHYWTSNARELIAELQIQGQRFSELE